MTLHRLALAPLLLLAAPAAAQTTPDADVSVEQLQADVERLVAFGTRHTLSSQDDPQRGIGAALDWGAAQFAAISAGCAGCLEVVQPELMVSGNRMPAAVRLRNVVAIQRGLERPGEVVIVQAHIDSRVSDVMDARSDAPGANDNASGSALVLEAARVLSRQRYPGTIVYALLSGEEQGLYGGALLADYALEQGWTVKAVLNNDIVGGSCGSDGYCDDAHVRVFSEGERADADDATRAQMRSRGGGNDSPSRNLSRWVDGLAAQVGLGVDVRQVWRSDRMGRGGDHIPFLERGLPAIRFSVAVEDYNHQHQDLRSENGIDYGDTVDRMDFPYLARVTRLNVTALDRLARAPMPPQVRIDGVVRPDVLLEWLPVGRAVRYNVWRRATDTRDWDLRLVLDADAAAELNSLTLAPDRGDDWIFGVSAVAADGSESPVASAVPGGDFAPLVPAP
ncbi:M28 family peptidase [Alteraurantiacibacter buctensis]|uniref:M20/M25/M40 family metallo-hydrolase n=1 Tax=Alteraurantiacibacter buctensis TaxID=1503981 RepID=A0A844Z0D9_9SPHN|nr:M28 family peptidase [Alteraurantiacibacter buctensis]MXO72174.1 M20/M25/M40 family metallo-hydrolase [Alteraurantiacibacter buctensis]